MGAGNDPDALFRRYRREAVLLHQPWPPHAGPPTNSHFGGLPRLPESHTWPRTSGGTPLHFMAQIDCADIRFTTVLPERGVLFFFGRGDRYTWNREGPASDTCRVLYALDAGVRTPLRHPPADLPSLESSLTESNVHFGWPVVPLPFDSFPEESALPYPGERDKGLWRRLLDRFVRGASDEPEISDDVREAYAEQLDARRAAALMAAAGLPRTSQSVPGAGRDAGRTIFHFAASGAQSFPQYWAYIHHLALRFLDIPRSYSLGEKTPGERVAKAEYWLARSREVPLEQPVAEEDRQALRAWLAGLDDHPVLVSYAAADTLRSFAGDPILAALVPDHVYAAYASYYSGYDEFNPHFSQMLGHAPACHQARDVDDPIICLLNIDADRGLAWDVASLNGKATFWITPDALARRDFSKVVGRLDGRS
ncbi:DUF1963 domain-containing protein [Longimicrobium sp.]|uniref:DUF1963 domain-containing protein n=1 Tax=Longimicrobium sp. TaxID=2029185 RepID=UPI002E37D245|nr:DUF1963 domain-containing protein [Longimicrobium sp.]HEX6038553.1 DUF1963 domain-containing protein [Longimicrobium sp.]